MHDVLKQQAAQLARLAMMIRFATTSRTPGAVVVFVRRRRPRPSLPFPGASAACVRDPSDAVDIDHGQLVYPSLERRRDRHGPCGGRCRTGRRRGPCRRRPPRIPCGMSCRLRGRSRSRGARTGDSRGDPGGQDARLGEAAEQQRPRHPGYGVDLGPPRTPQSRCSGDRRLLACRVS